MDLNKRQRLLENSDENTNFMKTLTKNYMSNKLNAKHNIHINVVDVKKAALIANI